MGFLDKLWDDTLAGPAPDSGLEKLRKYNSFPRSQRLVGNVDRQGMPVTRSITVLRNNNHLKQLSVVPGSDPASPVADCTTPVTPLTPGSAPSGDSMKRFSRGKSSAEAFEQAESRSPTVFDWVVINALDH